MQVGEIYEGLRGQAEILTIIEQRLTQLIAVNAKNLEVIIGARSVNDLPTYFRNQHRTFNALLEATGDTKIINSYTLFELECQLRGDDPQKTEPDETDFRKV